VATEESARWTDYTYQVIQFIKESNSEVSFEVINNYFPYLKHTDCSLLMTIDAEEDESEVMIEPDGWATAEK